MRFTIDAVVITRQTVVYDYVFVIAGTRIYAGPSDNESAFWLVKNKHQSLTP